MGIQVLITIWLFVTVVLLFLDIKWGISLFLFYFLLVPGFNIGIQGLGKGENIFYFVILIAFLYHFYKKNIKIDFKYLSPFFLLFLFELIVIPFQNGMPLSDNIYHWLKSFMKLFLPFIMWNVMKNDEVAVIYLRRTLLICIVINLSYSFFQTTIGGANPYIMYMSGVLDEEVKESYFLAETNRGRLFGRISSTFFHPMTFALFLGCSAIYLFFYLKYAIRKKIIFIVMIASFIMILLCGVRSVIGGMSFAIAYYLVASKKTKIFIYASIIGIVTYGVIKYIPELDNYIQSMINANNSDLAGSSIDMRLNQLQGAFDIMMQNPMFGLGNNWTLYYLLQHEMHPVCSGFESLIMVVICNWGIIGIITWLYMILSYFRINKLNKLVEINVFNSLIVFYISYSTITGEYHYMKYFLIFYVMMLAESQLIIKKYGNKSNRIVSSSVSLHS